MGTEETTASDSRTADFLDVEEVARSIAARLSRLDEEANRYSSAATNLDGAAAATHELVGAVRDIGERAAKVLDVVTSVGGPEIVSRLGTLEARHAEQSKGLMKKVMLAVYLAGAAAALALVAVIVALVK